MPVKSKSSTTVRGTADVESLQRSVSDVPPVRSETQVHSTSDIVSQGVGVASASGKSAVEARVTTTSPRVQVHGATSASSVRTDTTALSLDDYLIPAQVALSSADAQGFRVFKGRRYVDIHAGGSVQVGVDPVTGQHRARLSSEINPSGPVLVRGPESDVWYPLDTSESIVFRSAGSKAQEIEFNGKRYFTAPRPDAGDGQHHVLRVLDPNNPSALVSSGIIAAPDALGVWKRRGRKGGMQGEESDEEFVLAAEFAPRKSSADEVFEMASESMPFKPYTAEESSIMRQPVPYSAANNQLGSYNRANNGRYPIRGADGQPMYIKAIEGSSTLVNGNVYAVTPVMPYLKAGGFENVARLYEEKLQLRTFTEADIVVPGEKTLVGQSMVVANRRIVKGEVIGVYGGDLVPHVFLSREEQVFAMTAATGIAIESGRAREVKIAIVGDNIVSRINTNFVFNKEGRPIRQAPAGYNVETVPFAVEVEDRSGGQAVRRGLDLSTVFATADIPAGQELRLNYNYSPRDMQLFFG
ncbi:hypothetical protein [Pseudomonas sp. Sample_9]|uniref:hypothetical protein n=1 Tax=Pseudomonas sp. Sample_9 TaxID=2382158 RepID=UPI0010328209|nr:hypothetical protein [Pseudomonas sp. Sample_9]